MKRKIPMIALLFALLPWAQVGAAADYIIVSGEPSLVSFLSKAPMEKFEGKTRQVSGRIQVDLAELAAGASVEVHVDLASLDTGLKKRNAHMCDNHLEVEKYPEAVFKADQVLNAPTRAIGPGESVDFKLKGSFSLHGVTRDIEVPVELSVGADGSLHVKSHFQVKLADYEINRPKFLVLKLDEVQRVSVDLLARIEG
jgi:polyisoprenoid-binding protein YceI